MVADVSYRLDQAMKSGQRLLFEGAAGFPARRRPRHYPYVTSSNTVAAAAAVEPASGRSG